MKKTIYNIAIALLVVGGLTSCDSELDQIPFDSLGNENAYITAADFENGARGIYFALANENMYGGSDFGGMLDAPDILSDNVTFSTDGRQTRKILHNWNYSPSQGPNMYGTYAVAYQMIYRANLLIENSAGFEGDNKNKVVAEAKALRALAHLNAASFFAKIPTQSADANGSLGIAYMTVADSEAAPSRETVGTVYEKIAKDLEEALPFIEVTAAPGRLTKDGVNILLSRVYLYMGENEKAITAASNVAMPIENRDDVVGVWDDSTKNGVALYIPVDPSVLTNLVGVTWSQGGMSNLIPEYVVSFDLYNAFASDDIRKDAYTMQAANNGKGHSYNAIKKYFKRAAGGAAGELDIKILRAAEAKLNLAEANFKLGNETAARTALDAVRTKRYLNPPAGETGTALRDAIRLERRLELAFEYQRFFDLKRWGLPIERTNAGDFADGSGTPSDERFLPAGDNKFQLPFDQSILDRNPNMVQNPGY